MRWRQRNAHHQSVMSGDFAFVPRTPVLIERFLKGTGHQR